MRSAPVLAATLTLLAACGEDEIVKRAKEKDAATTAAPSSVPAHADVRPGEPTPGVPAEPTPAAPGTPQPGMPATPQPVPGAPQGDVQPGEPTPGIPDPPKPGIPSQPPPGGGGGPMLMDGPTAKVSGNVIFSAWKAGTVRVDAFDGDHTRPGTQPKIVATLRLEKPGPFSLDVPLKAGKVYIEAAIDEDGDGKPGPQEPQGTADRYPVTVSGDVSGLSVTLTKRAPPPGGKNKDDF